MSQMYELIDKLEFQHELEKEEWIQLIGERNEEIFEELRKRAVKIRKEYYGNEIYVRGLVEISNYCRNDCFYCGIRCSNKSVNRYRLTPEEIILCADEGYKIGFHTVVLQGGEDMYYSDEILSDIIKEIKRNHPNQAVTLSIGEKEREQYQKYFDAGADRYLLRHETANDEHYAKLHPKSLSSEHRKQCLYDLKSIGYQTGTGFMIGSPYQTTENLAEDMMFIKELNPQMVGIGPFVPHHATPFANQKGGTVELTLFMLSCIRIMLPGVLLPSTTALGTIDEYGREKGILAGANVLMPNLSPAAVRKSYELYDNKLCTGDEAAESKKLLEERMKKIGYEIVCSRGDYISVKK